MPNIFQKLKSEYAKKYKDNTMNAIATPYNTPQIYHGGKHYDTKRRWYVYFSFKDEKTGKLIRQKPIYGDANQKGLSKAERLHRLKRLKKELTRLLKEGYSPYETANDTNIYTPQQALEHALDIKKNTVSLKTYQDYCNRANNFVQYLKKQRLHNTDVRNINKATVNTFLNTLLKNTSIRNRNNTKSTLSALFSVLEQEDIIPNNFILHIKNIKTVPRRHRAYTKEQVKTIFNYLSQHDPLLLLYVKIISLNFLRPIEVCRLRVGDIDLDRKRLSVKAKNKPLKIKIIPQILAADLKEVISKSRKKTDVLLTPYGPGKWEQDEVARRNYFTRRFARHVKKTLDLGKDYTIYSFRHTFITKLYNELIKTNTQTETLEQLRLITGHETIKALMMYLRDIDAILPEDYSHLLQDFI